MWSYSQKTGELTRNGALIGVGYSGHGQGLDNPDMETITNVGPIPQGFYTVEVIHGEDGLPCDYEGKAAPVMRLIPKPGTETFGRSGFLCHGDDVHHVGQNVASLGCVVMPKYVRQQWASSEDKDLEVIP